MSSTMPRRSNTTASLASAKALANCAQDYHQWHPTFSLGEKLCTVCGARAYCPGCRPRFPDPKLRVMSCALHQIREEEKQEKEARTP